MEPARRTRAGAPGALRPAPGAPPSARTGPRSRRCPDCPSWVEARWIGGTLVSVQVVHWCGLRRLELPLSDWVQSGPTKQAR